MSRVGMTRTLKFKKLAFALGLPGPYARGLLETMWDCTWESGSPVLGGPIDVELAAEWPGEPGKLFAALRDHGWIDPLEGDLWVVHDWNDHLPAYVRERLRKRLERETKSRATADVSARDTGHADAEGGPGGPESGTSGHASAQNKGQVAECPQQVPDMSANFSDASAACPGQVATCPGHSPSETGTSHSIPFFSEEDSDTSCRSSPDLERGHPRKTRTPDSETQGDEVLAAWNALGSPFVRGRPAAMTPKRRTALRARLADPAWRAQWRDALERVRGRPWCRGETERSEWVATLDWCLRPDTVTKALEGQFDGRRRDEDWKDEFVRNFATVINPAPGGEA